VCQGVLEVLEQLVFGVKRLLDFAAQLLDQPRVDLSLLHDLLDLDFLLLLLFVQGVDLLRQQVILLFVLPAHLLHVLLEFGEELVPEPYFLVDFVLDFLEVVAEFDLLGFEVLHEEFGCFVIFGDLLEFIVLLDHLVFGDDGAVVVVLVVHLVLQRAQLQTRLVDVLLEFGDFDLLVLDQLNVVARDVPELVLDVVLVLLVLAQQPVDVRIHALLNFVDFDLEAQLQVFADLLESAVPHFLGLLQRGVPGVEVGGVLDVVHVVLGLDFGLVEGVQRVELLLLFVLFRGEVVQLVAVLGDLVGDLLLAFLGQVLQCELVFILGCADLGLVDFEFDAVFLLDLLNLALQVENAVVLSFVVGDHYLLDFSQFVIHDAELVDTLLRRFYFLIFSLVQIF